MDLFKGLFKRETSSQTAKDRLRLVLMSDHLSLAPEVIEALKADLLAVISQYVEIDPAQADVSFESRDREVAMLANIPILALRDRPLPAPPRPGGSGNGSAQRGSGAAMATLPRLEDEHSEAEPSANFAIESDRHDAHVDAATDMLDAAATDAVEAAELLATGGTGDAALEGPKPQSAAARRRRRRKNRAKQQPAIA